MSTAAASIETQFTPLVIKSVEAIWRDDMRDKTAVNVFLTCQDGGQYAVMLTEGAAGVLAESIHGLLANADESSRVTV